MRAVLLYRLFLKPFVPNRLFQPLRLFRLPTSTHLFLEGQSVMNISTNKFINKINLKTAIIPLFFTLFIVIALNYSSLLKFAANIGLYQGNPIVIYVAEELANRQLGYKKGKSTINFEEKESKNLKLVRIDNVYQIYYKPSHLKRLPDPKRAWQTLFHIGYSIFKNNKSEWTETSMHADLIPYVEFLNGQSVPSEGRGKGKAAIWIDKDLAQIIKLAPISATGEYIDPHTKQEYVKIYPVTIKAIGDGYAFIEKQTTHDEQERYHYPHSIAVGIHKTYFSKVEFDK